MEKGRLLKVIFSGYLILILAVCFLFSCSGRVDRPEVAVKKMICAYGGAEKIDFLTNYVGKGFMKNLSSKSVVSHYPFDLYQKDHLFKNRFVKVTRGKVTDIRVTVFDGREAYQWQYGEGKKDVPMWEFAILKYRFPLVLKWLRDSRAKGEIITDAGVEGVCRMRYLDGDDIVTFSLDDKSWLLKEVEIQSATDSAFVYSEAYSDYRDMDGIPFPNRFTGTFKGQPYYEYFIPVIEYGVDLPDSLFKVTAEDTAEIFLQALTGEPASPK
ncbi:MAG: hypothetical protein KAX38_07955 [Candidatus Krumholzibacteria bacterium]|nr:hypothetical protein [Candidatus Krumholzibacteria bacterium]